MASVTTEFKRLLLRGIQWDGQEAGLTLEQSLKAACRARYSETNTGQVLVAASGNGSSVTFGLPQNSYSADAVAGAVSALQDEFEESKADLIEGGTESPTSAQILAEMLARLKPVRSAHADRREMSLA